MMCAGYSQCSPTDVECLLSSKEPFSSPCEKFGLCKGIVWQKQLWTSQYIYILWNDWIMIHEHSMHKYSCHESN
jgi:hypothetical protein